MGAFEKGKHFVLGADFGSDSVRVVILDAADGTTAGTNVSYYPRWKEDLFCDPKKNRFSQHPLDYTESLVRAVTGALTEAGSGTGAKIRAVCIDTTGSTPALADRNGMPLALRDEFAAEPDAMFILWKDHTAVSEADEINTLSHTWGGTDYTRYCGGTYSSEWFWSKILHVIRNNGGVKNAAITAVEHCDWMTALLTDTTAPEKIKRSRCAAGHKCMWHRSWGGYPSEEFLARLDPVLARIRKTLGTETWTTDTVAGTLSPEWAGRLGLSAGIPVCVGAYDAHIGAVGGGAAPGVLVKSIGTSTCDVIIGPRPENGGPEKCVAGICGQVDGSVISGWTGYEAGQSAYGDYFAWFRNMLMWPLRHTPDIAPGQAEAVEKNILRDLEDAAENIAPEQTSPVALDWINGRRTPGADQNMRAAVFGLNLGTDAPAFMRTLLESTAFGARAIIECLERGGIAIEKVTAVGGVARKSRLGMQILADVTNREIHVTSGDQSCAVGAAVFAAAAAGLYGSVPEAQKALCPDTERVHKPDPHRAAVYDTLYGRYLRLGAFTDAEIHGGISGGGS